MDLGRINGKSDTTYDPDANLTYAEAAKLAACMNMINKDGRVGGLAASNPWYSTYVIYCETHHIITKDYSWDRPAIRSDYMEIFANALPDEDLEAINTVESIPDVAETHPNAAAIFKLYRAGIVTGVDSIHNCNPNSNIKRSEVATILVRMMDKTQRQTFTIGGGGGSTEGGSTATSSLKITTQPKGHQMTSSSDNVTFSVSVSGEKAEVSR